MLSGKPPPVMWASALIAAGRADRGEHRLHIDARRLEQRLAEAAAGRERRRRRPTTSPEMLDDPAHQREAVRMHAGGGEAEQHVARRDVVGRGRSVPRSAAPTAKPARS